MRKHLRIFESESLSEIENKINSIYDEAEQKNLDATIVSFNKTAGFVGTNMYGGYLRITPCYTAVLEVTPKRTNQ
jgi:hypothetical protein